jgi:hypothetical protein
MCDFFFTTSDFANKKIKASGIPDERIFFVGMKKGRDT